MSKGSSGTNTVETQSQPPAWLQTELQSLGSAGQQAATQPLQQYSGSMVAGFSPDQQQAMSTIDNSQGIAQPFINSGAQYLGQAAGTNLQSTAQPYLDQAQQLDTNAANTNVSGAVNPYLQSATSAVNPANISQFESPYTQQVVNATQNEFNNQNAQSQQGIISNAISAGAFGGDRASVAQGIAAGQEQLAQAPTIAGLENSGYTNAQSAAAQNANVNLQAGSAAGTAASQGANLGLQAGQGITGLGSTALGANEAQGWLNSSVGTNLASLGSQSQNSALTGASAQLQTGALQQQLGQEQLNVPYEQFLQQQAYPQQQLGWLSGIEEGTAGSAGGSSSTTSPTNYLSQLGGLGLTGLSAVGASGGFGANGWLTGAGSAATSGAGDAAASGAADVLATKRGGVVAHRAAGGGLGNGVIGGQIPGIFNTSLPGGGLISDKGTLGTIMNLTGNELPGISTNSITMNEAPAALSFILAKGGVVPKRAPGGTTSSGSGGAGGVTPADISTITQDYQNDLGRAPDLSGLQFYENAVSNGTPLSQINSYISNSPEEKADIGQDYNKYLSRPADSSGTQFYQNAIENGTTTLSQLPQFFVNSPEYQGKFGNPNVSESVTQNGGVIPQVKQSVFNTPSANVTALNGGQTINALPQYQPAMNGTTGNVSFPHTTYANPLAGYFPSTTTPTPTPAPTGSGSLGHSKNGGVIPFPADRIKRRDDGGDVPDDTSGGITGGNVVSPSNWRQSSLTDAPAYQPMNTSAIKDQIQNPHVDPWMALAHAGLSMLAGTSPNGLTNLGRGLQAGLGEYNQEKQQAQQAASKNFDIDARAQDMADRADQWRQQSGVAKEQAAEAVARDASNAANQTITQQQQAARDAATQSYNAGQLKIQQQQADTAKANAAANNSTSYTYTPGAQADASGKNIEGAWKIGDDNTREFVPGMIIQKPGDGGAASPMDGIANSGKTGPDLMNSLPTPVQARVKAMIEGREPAPTGAALRDPDVNNLVSVAHQVDPNFDETTWGARAALRKSFLGGGAGSKDIGSPIQAINHLDELDTNLKALPNLSAGPFTTAANWVANGVSNASDNPAVTNAKRSALAVSDELGKSWHGAGSVPESQVKAWSDAIPINGGPQTKADVAPKTIDLMDGQFDKMRNTWQSTFGPNIAMPPQLTQATQEKYDRLSNGKGRYISQDLPVQNGQPDFGSMKIGSVYKTAKGYAQFTGDPAAPFQPLTQ